MKLISCDSCGVVLDADKLEFPEEVWDEDDIWVNQDQFEWDGDTNKACIDCPCCGERIKEP